MKGHAERTTLRIVGWCFLALAVYVAADSAKTLWLREAPDTSVVGMALTALSVVVMPLLARAKREVAAALSSAALRAEAGQTSLCAYLSAITLGGLALNAILGWWWADPVAALCMVPIIAKEGVAAVRGDEYADCSDWCYRSCERRSSCALMAAMTVAPNECQHWTCALSALRRHAV